MTLRMYSNHKGYRFGSITTEVTHERDGDGPADARQDIFHRVVIVEGVDDEAMREKIVEIAAKCPVHRTLERSSRVETVYG